MSNSPEDVAGQQLTAEKLGRARSSGIVAPLPDEVGAAEGARASHRPVAVVDVDRRRSLSVESAPAELILACLDRAPIFEEAGCSLFGPAAVNIAAPDEGDVQMLAHIADADQKEQFLAPLARGEVRSAFAMTEPAPGAGSDPSALRTRARKVAGGWKIMSSGCCCSGYGWR